MKRIGEIVILVSMLLFVACSTQKPLHVSVEPVKKGTELSGHPLVYALPRTSLVIRVQAVKTIYVPGPFRKYAEKYLGIKPVVTNNRVVWSLKTAEISSYSEPDPENYFTIHTNGTLVNNALSLTAKGLLLDIAQGTGKKVPAFKESSDEPDGKPYFTDVSVKRNFVEKEDTVYRTVMQDTGFVKIPIVKKSKAKKTFEDKAGEAANFIIKIRKRRFKLLSGQYKVYPEGIALEYAVKQLTRLEKEYMALFIGKQVSQTWYYRFLYTPHDPAKQQVLFRVSEKAGICESGSCKGIPVYFKWKTAGNVPVTGSFSKISLTDSTHLFYRIPELTDVSVFYGDRILAEKHVFIYQFGPVIELFPNVILEGDRK